MTPGSWRAASACGTWLWWPCRPRRGPTRRGAMVRACRWHQAKQDRGDQSTLSHSSPHAATRWRGRREGRFKLPTPVIDCHTFRLSYIALSFLETCTLFQTTLFLSLEGTRRFYDVTDLAGHHAARGYCFMLQYIVGFNNFVVFDSRNNYFVFHLCITSEKLCWRQCFQVETEAFYMKPILSCHLYENILIIQSYNFIIFLLPVS
jgi:hypothetical protein